MCQSNISRASARDLAAQCPQPHEPARPPPADAAQDFDGTYALHRDLKDLMLRDALAQERVVAVMAVMLEETVNATDAYSKCVSLPSFCGPRPLIAPADYVDRIMRYSGASPCCLLIGAIYLERLKQRDPQVYLTLDNYQRLFLLAVMTASKFLDDYYVSNKRWAAIGGISLREINQLELEFLYRLSFTLYVKRSEYDWYAEELHRRADAMEEKAKAAAEVEVPYNKFVAYCSIKPSTLERSESVESQLSANSTPRRHYIAIC